MSIALPFLLLPGLSYGSGGGVEGMVRFRGEAVPGAWVEVFENSGTRDGAVDATNTGTDGRFELSLPPGAYRLTVKKRPEGPGSGGMLFGSHGKDPLKVGRTVINLGAIELRDMGAGDGIAGGILITGSVHGADDPLPGAYIYFYPEGVLRGPGYLTRARAGEGGRFRAGLAPGTYNVTVRYPNSGNGSGAEGMGTVSVQDLVGDYPSNPLQVAGADLDIGRIDVRPVNAEKWEERRWAGVKEGLRITGVVVREDRSPMEGAYVFLYDDPRMVGKPLSISAPTGGDGRYKVVVSGPGTYYVGARTRFGGPVEPGEFMGAWDEKGPKPVVLEGETASATCEIVVREVW